VLRNRPANPDLEVVRVRPEHQQVNWVHTDFDSTSAASGPNPNDK
jgi:hypothetical protein